MGAYVKGLKNYANFRGRATRSDFWLFHFIATVIILVVAAVEGAGKNLNAASDVGPFTYLMVALHVIPSWSLLVRRLHDTGRSGWWVLLSFTGPLAIVLIYFTLKRSDPQTNRFDAPANGSEAAAGQSPAEKLAQLADLKEKGAITDEEFIKLKNQILA